MNIYYLPPYIRKPSAAENETTGNSKEKIQHRCLHKVECGRQKIQVEMTSIIHPISYLYKRKEAGFELQPEKKSLATITAPGECSNITIIQMPI